MRQSFDLSKRGLRTKHRTIRSVQKISQCVSFRRLFQTRDGDVLLACPRTRMLRCKKLVHTLQPVYRGIFHTSVLQRRRSRRVEKFAWILRKLREMGATLQILARKPHWRKCAVDSRGEVCSLLRRTQHETTSASTERKGMWVFTSSGEIVLRIELSNAACQHVVYGCPTYAENFCGPSLVAFDDFKDVFQVANLDFL